MKKIRITREHVIKLLNGQVAIKRNETEVVIDTLTDGENLIAVIVSSETERAEYFEQKSRQAQRRSEENFRQEFDSLFDGIFGKTKKPF